jgi:hypothetical protein
MRTNSISVDSPSSREITCFQTIYDYALAGCKTESDRIILQHCAKPVEKLLIKEALARKENE